MISIADFQKLINYTFSDQQLLLQALVHRSSLNEQRQFTTSNERLEFLGDAILEAWSSDYLYRHFPNLSEGDLTNLRSLIVRTETLSQLCQQINLNQIIFLSKGEEAHGGRLNMSILADTFESLIGAIYLDGGSVNSSAFLDRYLIPLIDTFSQQQIFKDPKSQFQEIAQSNHSQTPTYKTLEESGPDHQKIFTVGLYLDDNLIATGSGHSKQKAEESAAIEGIKILTKS